MKAKSFMRQPLFFPTAVVKQVSFFAHGARKSTVHAASFHFAARVIRQGDGNCGGVPVPEKNIYRQRYLAYNIECKSFKEMI